MAQCTARSYGQTEGTPTYYQCSLEEGHIDLVEAKDADGNVVGYINIGLEHDYQPVDQATWEALNG
jgi:hypothetical protein